MDNKTYTLLDFSEIFGKDKQTLRRRISRLKIESINKDSREFPNDPLRYDHQAYLTLVKEFGDAYEEQKKTRNSYEEQEFIKVNQLVEVLERELNFYKDRFKKSEEEKETLMRLLDQEQQLSLMSNKKVEELKLELSEKQKEIEISSLADSQKVDSQIYTEKKKKKWWQFFK